MLKDYKLKVGLFTHCIDCKERHIGCHSQCAFYIADRNTLNERKNKVRKEELRTKTETVAYVAGILLLLSIIGCVINSWRHREKEISK